MKKIDVKKIYKSPKDKWEAIDIMIETQSKLCDSLFILLSVVENPSKEYKEIHEKRINDFLKDFLKD
jgi:hypothetical protein